VKTQSSTDLESYKWAGEGECGRSNHQAWVGISTTHGSTPTTSPDCRYYLVFTFGLHGGIQCVLWNWFFSWVEYLLAWSCESSSTSWYHRVCPSL